MAEEDIHKTAFRCPGHLGLFKWVVMTFGLNYIFLELIGKIVEIYIDDVVVKSKGHQEHLADLRRALECTRRHGLKMNPKKCAFGVSAGQFLGFMVHDRGVEISQKLYRPSTKLKPLKRRLNFSH